ncbi:MAG: hypothetical protein EXR21_02250 [Flavobacteriaceae bacterium]|nr:hypothetical protein [Flavobacteriaceae bacterium]
MKSFDRTVLVFHLTMMILYIGLGIMFLTYDPNPIGIPEPYSTVLGYVMILYGTFRGARAGRHLFVK